MARKVKCPVCRKAEFELFDRGYTVFYRCANYPKCSTMQWCDRVTKKRVGQPFDGVLSAARSTATAEFDTTFRLFGWTITVNKINEMLGWSLPWCIDDLSLEDCRNLMAACSRINSAYQRKCKLIDETVLSDLVRTVVRQELETCELK